MEISAELDQMLYDRYPAAFADRHGDPSYTSMCFGFQIGDGWFGLVDALCETLTYLASLDGSRVPVVQSVKQKFGRLRFDIAADPATAAALELAQELSIRVCEISGHPGRACHVGRHTLMVLAAGQRPPGALPVSLQHDAEHGRSAGWTEPLPMGFSLDDLVTRGRGVLNGPIAVPRGWYDLVDSLFCVVQQRHGATDGMAKIQSIGRDQTGLWLDWTEDDVLTRALSASARALSQRIDATSGTVGRPTLNDDR